MTIIIYNHKIKSNSIYSNKSLSLFLYTMTSYNHFVNNLILTLTSLLILSSSLEVVINETKYIELQIDQIYSQQIPSFFELYQAASIKKFVKTDSPQQILADSQICHIEDDQDSQYIEQSQYFHSHLADPSKYYLGLKKVASFDDLFKLTGIVDIITVDQNKVIVLFQNGFYTSYQINKDNGKIIPQFVRHILHNDKMNINASQFGNRVYDRVVGFGDLLYDKSFNSEYIIFFGQEQALIMNKTTKTFQFLKGYEVMGQSYGKATLTGNKIYVATGFQGVFVYEVDFEKKEIKQKQKIRPYYKDSQGIEVYLVVSQIIYDPTTTQLILTDLSQGIYWVNISSNSWSAELNIECLPNPILIQNCENMNYIMLDQQQQNNNTSNNVWTPILVATCPQLLIVTLNGKRTHRIIDEISFYPQTVITNSSRVLLFGDYKYAVYDLQTSLVEQGQGERTIDFVTISKQRIVIVNMLYIYSGKIFAQTETIVCAANNDNGQQTNDIVGKYQFILQIQGICSQLYAPNFISLTNPNNPLLPIITNLQQLPTLTSLGPQQCFLKYNISLSINNTSKLSYFWQIIIGIVIVWILVGGMIVYCVKDIKIDKEYNKLIEQNVNSSMDKNKDQVIEQATNQQMFSQQKQQQQQKK